MLDEFDLHYSKCISTKKCHLSGSHLQFGTSDHLLVVIHWDCSAKYSFTDRVSLEQSRNLRI